MLSPLILGPFLLAALPSSIAAPTLAIQTENPAVIFRTFGGNADVHACLRGENPTYTGIPDGGCYNLPGNYMEVRQIADTCRGMYNAWVVVYFADE